MAFAVINETTGNNDTFANAQTVDLGYVISGKINSSTDVDWYRYYVPSGSPLVVSLIDIATNCDYDIYVHNASNQQLGFSLRTGNQSEFVRIPSSQITYSGYYYVKISKYANYSTTVNYSLCALSKDNMTTANTNTTFNRTNAAAYANSYCITPNESSYCVFTQDCTNFASQCLFAGGLPMKQLVNPETRDSNTVWFNNDVTPFTSPPPTAQYSATWADANSLKRYLTKICDLNGVFAGKAYGWKTYTGEEGNINFSEVYGYLSPGDLVIWLNRDNPTGWHSQVVKRKYTESGINKIEIAQHTDNNFKDLQSRLSANKSYWALLIKIRN